VTFKPYADQTDQELMGLAGVQGGASLESMRRLRVAVESQTSAVERQSRASGRLTWAIIALMVVQILVSGAQVTVALVAIARVGR